MTNHLQCPKCASDIPWQTKMIRRHIRCLGCGVIVSPSKSHAAILIATWFFVFYLFGVAVGGSFGNPLLYMTAFALFLAHYVVFVPLVIRPGSS